MESNSLEASRRHPDDLGHFVQEPQAADSGASFYRVSQRGAVKAPEGVITTCHNISGGQGSGAALAGPVKVESRV